MKYNAILAALLTISSPLMAQDIERITVTGDFRQATLDQLSSSATVLSNDRLNARQATFLDDILNVAPNVNFASGASRGRFVQIRGIGERSQFAEPINPSVSFLVDDFDFSGLGAAGVLFDTQQVEIFRGPQSTLFGTGALAGAIKIVSNQPDEEQESHAELRLANKDAYRIEAATGSDITDNVRYRLAVVKNASDGFVNNTFLNVDDTANISETAARAALQWDLSDTSTLDVNYRWYDIDNGYDAFSLDNTRTSLADQPGFDRQQTHAVSAKLSTLYKYGTLTSILTHASHNLDYGFDEDWTYTGFHPFGYTSFDAYYRSIETQTAEVRFTSSPSALLFNDTTSWLVGTLYKATDEDLLREYTYANGDFVSEYQPTTKALYGETVTEITPDISITTGLRFENYGFDYADNQGLSREYDTDMVGGKVALQYTPDTHTWYASISRGFKGAGINPAQRVTEEERFFDEEYNWNYELGVKGPFLVPEATVRAAIFYMQRDNTQVNDYDVLIRDDGTPEFIDIIDNADLGTNRGVEIEADWLVTAIWQLQGSVGYLDAKFEEYTNARGDFIAEQRQAQAPRWTANLFSRVLLSDQWSWQADIDFKDRYRFSDGHDVMSPSTTLVNTQLKWEDSNWYASIWANNLFDKTYYVRGFGGFSNDPRDGEEGYGMPEPYYQLGPGRQYGVTVGYQF
ncbi:TonB-dependent receptor [Salinimonas chungwhensis]|uniref:TonB-dependent receptor n=1 Tax=Salinimonas chungwhensis TaxID=265425 RepID=UPI0003A09854|nr:TonB-dependent receptor [Salinimonas chungwhensis]